ncbi:hypothetical protein EPJ64_02635 [Brachyspira aalborgi]|uniref:DUF2206 domain-containing protein n=1 Tax=Brachyspira aalborgi TaxID=29522 RepID=A0AB38Q0N8_9SPIR|nr:hypothetical protein [Brachyspira aalborgi]TXJ16696.1 hypothetical protein EPJ77_02140 [Brachyspira aalborgi]TXJ22106.1 hypothetical protein EPJ64_02635 [Brachyspira aalborgi]TXJ26863.1 hypothetical protein EPJ73_03485 [Brachyspira aalborgi]TXJ50652.1 hypothetical protein EPJ75_02080 [Brachyspira aalborgi]
MISKTKIYILFVIIISITLIILQILGSKNRIGYLTDFKLNVYKTLELNNLNDIREEFTIDGKLDEENIKNYLLTNENITNYIYQFRIRYYDKVFRNSDIYGVYPDLSNLPDYMKNAEMEKGGSPFGYLTSDKIIDNEEKIDNINYKLRVKPEIINPVIIIFFILIVLLFKNNSKNVFNIITSIFNKKPEESSLNYNQNISEKFIINFLFSLIATIILVFILKLFNLSDVQIYALSLIFITLCFYFISVKNIPFIEKLYNTFIYDEKNRILIYLIILIFIVSLSNTFIELKEWNYLQFLNLNILNILNIWSEKYINDNILPFIIEIILTAFLLYILINLSNNYLAIFLSIVAVILIIYGKFQVAIIDTHHHTAHFNSVFMVYNHIPYSKNMYSILGHYALLTQPFFKVFGLNVKTYALLMSILCGISALCVIITIFLLIKSSFFRILGILITFFIYFTMEFNYYAIAPLRIFFPSIMILYTAIIGNRKNILLTIIGYFIVSLSILWNAETGLVCLASLFISNIYAYCYDLTFKDKKLYYNILLLIIFSICSLLIAYLILNICNIYLLGGEKQNIKDLLFPLITGQVNYTEIKIKKLFNYYFIVVLIFLTTFIYYIKNMRIFNNGDIKLKYYIPSIIYISVCALGVYAYAINRTAFFNSMVLMPMISIIIPFILYRLYLLLNKKSELSLSLYNIILTIFIIGIFSSISISVNNFTNFYNPVSNNFYNYMQTKDDEKNGYTYIVTEFMKEYGFNGIASFGGAFVYGYANLGWTNSLILPNESDWWNPSFGYSNAIKIFMDNKPNIFFSGKTLNVYSFYHNQNYNDSVDLFNKYVENYYTNITTKYEEYGFYLYMLK